MLGNVCVGSIPSDIGSLTNLGYFNIYDNKLDGLFPKELCSLTSLYVLGKDVLCTCVYDYLIGLFRIDFSNNKIRGSVPCNFEPFERLMFLYVSTNQLSGTISTTLASVASLVVADLSHNQFHGTFPFAHAHSLGYLQQIDLSFNQFSGRLSSIVATESTLHVIMLNNNRFTGSIDEDVFNPLLLKNMTFIDVSNNLFTGTITSTIFKLPQLQVFSASNNCFSTSNHDGEESLLPVKCLCWHICLILIK